jgi:maltoporin
LGGARLGISYFKTDANANDSGNRINVDAYDIAANAGGKLRFVATLTDGKFANGTSGLGLIAMHQQDNFLGLGGSNTLWLEYAQGSAGLNGNFGGLSDPSSSKKWRVVESFTFQAGAFGGQTLAMWERDKTATAHETHVSLGGRASYALTKNFKLVGELGHSQIKPDAGATKKLTKFTFAPTLSTGPGFWNRPELRLYVTSARWNEAAGNITGQAAFAGKTSGTSYGAQVETWF